MSERESGWAKARTGVVCDRCDWRYLVPEEVTLRACPHCGSTGLVHLDGDSAEQPTSAPPELVVPFGVSPAALAQQIAAFAVGIPYPPPDLVAAVLQQRVQRLYVPMWLVDADVTAEWSAEAGFDYEVVSHQERYTDGAGWRTAEVRETRVRWEPRVGKLERHYDNVVAPALESQAAIQRVLGSFRWGDALSLDEASFSDAVVRIPDRTPESAWPDAEAALQQRAAEECRTAAGADHVRSYRWSPAYSGHAWTLMLLPILASAYLDDDGLPQRVLIHGQTGRIYGAKRGSMKRAQRLSLIIGAVALAVFAVGLVLALLSLLFPPLLLVGIVIVLIAIPIAAGAAVPVARVWAYNRRQSAIPEEV